MKCEFQNKLNKKLQERKVSELDEIDQIYKKLKESLEVSQTKYVEMNRARGNRTG